MVLFIYLFIYILFIITFSHGASSLHLEKSLFLSWAAPQPSHLESFPPDVSINPGASPVFPGEDSSLPTSLWFYPAFGRPLPALAGWSLLVAGVSESPAVFCSPQPKGAV